MAAHLRPESIGAIEESGRLGVQFVVDTLAPCAVKLYWGVSETACQAFLQQGQQGQGPPQEASSPIAKPGGGSPNTAAGATSAGSGSSDSHQPLLPRSPLRGGGAKGAGSSSSPAGASSPEALRGVKKGTTQLELECRDLFPASEHAVASASVALPQGLGQQYRTPADCLVDPTMLGFSLEHWPATRRGPGGGEQPRRAESEEPPAGAGPIVPLVVAITARPRSGGGAGSTSSSSDEPTKDGTSSVDGHTQVSLVKFKLASEGLHRWRAEVAHQVVMGAQGAQRILGIYGFEEELDDVADCQVCFDRPKCVLLLPCRHCSVCEPCLRSLRDERCPMCRATFSAYLLLPLVGTAAGPPAIPARAGQSFAAPGGTAFDL